MELWSQEDEIELSAFVVVPRGLAATLRVRRGARVSRVLERSFYKLVAGKIKEKHACLNVLLCLEQRHR